MSLRFRLIALVIVALSMSLVLGGAIVLVNASRSVRNEMRAALLVGHQSVDAALREIEKSSDPQSEIGALVASFKGSRHLRVWAMGGAKDLQEYPVREHPPFGKAARWVLRLVEVAPQTVQIPVTVGGRSFGMLVIQTDPRNETVEVLSELGSSLAVLALFSALTIVLLSLFASRALRPLDHLSLALERVGQGDYGTARVGDKLPPELARLRDSFNRTAARLAAADADNQRLNEQLLTLQEEERNDIARDLHDEVGPLLFAINVDAGNMTRLLNEGRVAELASPLRSITEAARDLQRHVRGLLGRLRPIGLAEFGLSDALHNLVAFWRQRHPDVAYRLSVAPACGALGSRVDVTLYRIVQECLSNAVRHGKPTAIDISVDRDEPRDEVKVEVTDDGAGLRPEFAAGYGLIGMAERVRAAGGRLTLANRPTGGLVVHAVLPCSGGATTPSVRVSEAAQ